MQNFYLIFFQVDSLNRVGGEMSESLKPSELIQFFSSSNSFGVCYAKAISLTVPVSPEQVLASDQF